MATEEHLSYLNIKKIVINDLKSESISKSTQPVNNWAGDGYMTDTQLKKVIERRKKAKKGSKMLLEAFKLLNY